MDCNTFRRIALAQGLPIERTAPCPEDAVRFTADPEREATPGRERDSG